MAQRAVLLDSGPLGHATHPRAEQNRQVRQWIVSLTRAGATVVLPEIVDYEPLTKEVMLHAARLWAAARKQGLPTAPEDRLDVDVILAAQALELAEGGGEEEEEEVVVATTNPRHLSRFVDARDWQEIRP